jgi:hypothetical protein
MNPLFFIDPWGLCAERGAFGEMGQDFLGYGDAAVGFDKGIWQLGAHPIESINGIEYVIMHPGQTWNALKTDYSEGGMVEVEK